MTTPPPDLFPHPDRAEPRPPFPAHSDRPGRVLTGPVALAIARANLARWITEHARAGD